MEAAKTHWKALTHPDYIGAYALMQGEKNIDLIVTIETVKREIVIGADGKKEECTVAHLKGHKPMILNATNQKAITKALGTPFIEDWAGKSITLYVAKVKAFGDTVDALRVKTEAPVIKLPELTPQHPNWGKAITALKAGNSTIDDVKKKYSLSQENEKQLCDLSKSDAAQSAA
jgi:hypothetical protein